MTYNLYCTVSDFNFIFCQTFVDVPFNNMENLKFRVNLGLCFKLLLIQWVQEVTFVCSAWWISVHFVFHRPLVVNAVMINDSKKQFFFCTSAIRI